ncbi:MAG: hypothetical protein KAS63_01750 [Candidatus Heimdallarchaeota archaeon]|nr:hypothetical protein [Candidatus Heimdallarchaeota archaeon]MCK4954058.1 hypothetical protein [Candidatus Heimdallarchaeota archaeon]
MISFFGKKVEKAIISLPIFHSLTEDDFDEYATITKMKKYFLEEANKPLVEKDNIPIFSDTIVIDDYLAFRAVNNLFAANDIDEVIFEEDEKLVRESDWTKTPCIITIGGPRSNQKLAEVLHHFPSELQLIDIVHPTSARLGEWILTILPNKDSLNFGVTQENALGVILRMQNPDIPDSFFVALFGDRGESTLEVCKYLKNNINKLNRMVKNKQFVALVAVTGHNFSISQLMYVATYDQVMFSDSNLMSKFLKKK